MTLLRSTVRSLLLLSLALPVMAADAEKEHPATRGDVNAPVIDALPSIPTDATWVEAMQAEIDARIAAHAARSEAFSQRAKAASADDRLALMLEVEAQGEELILDVLRIQAHHARVAGRLELADRLDETLAQRVAARENRRTHASAPVNTVKREAPSQGGQR